MLALLLSACQLPDPVAPSAAEDATYKILSEDALGTAWAVGPHNLITAGHICDGQDRFALVTTRGIRFGAEKVDLDYDDDTVADVCLLQTERGLGPGLSLAQSMPAVGDAVYFVGYPQGEWTKSEGAYLGDVDGPAAWSNYTFSAPCDRGASGSAVLSDEGVFGVLVRLIVTEDATGFRVHSGVEGCVVTPLPDIQTILQKNHLR